VVGFSAVTGLGVDQVWGTLLESVES
jgi:hypothetical protein